MTIGKIGFIHDGSKSETLGDKLEKSYQKVIKLQYEDPELCLIQIEKIIETICKQMFYREVGPDPSSLTLDELINILILQISVPKIIAIHLRVMQVICSDTSNEEINEGLLEPCVQSLEVLLKWYLKSETPETLHLSINNPANNLDGYDERKKKETLGTSNFASIHELKKFSGDDGLIIGRQLRLSQKKSFEHCVCVGPTGSGKTASFFIPNILSLPNASMVVSDPKGELFRKTAAENIKQGKKVLVFNPYSQNTMKYNPLTLCRDVYEVRELAQVLLTNGNAAVEAMSGMKGEGSEWINMSVPLLTAFLLFVKELDPPKNTISYALELITDNDLETLKFLIESNSDNIWDQTAYKQFKIFMQSGDSEKTAASIKTVLSTNLQLFADPMIENATSANDIIPSMLRDQPTVLYVNVPEHKSAFLAPLMAPFYTQLMQHLIESDNKQPVYFMLDEFANIGIIPNIDRALATFRSRNISISIAIQSLNQLRQIYGEEKTHSILDNLKTKFVLPGLAYDSANYFSQLCGFKEIVTISKSISNGKDAMVSFSSSPQKRELISASEVRRLNEGEMIIIADNLNPFKDKQYRYYEDEKLLEKTSEELECGNFLIHSLR